MCEDQYVGHVMALIFSACLYVTIEESFNIREMYIVSDLLMHNLCPYRGTCFVAC